MGKSSFEVHGGEGPFVAIAIHDGHDLRPEVRSAILLGEDVRMREEDPHTGQWTRVAPCGMVALRSRFEVDLNRPRDRAVYLSPDDAWGLQVWRSHPPTALLERSLAQYDAFYQMLDELLSQKLTRHERVLVLDLHSYNHRRDGPQSPPDDPRKNPEINLGTGTMRDRSQWAPTIEAFIDGLRQQRQHSVGGRILDVRENVRFRGGNCARWMHQRFDGSVCVLSVEVKKFFMDEWTGVLDPALHAQVQNALVAGLNEVKRVWCES